MQVYFMICFVGFFVYSKASLDCNQSSFSACRNNAFSKSLPETEEELELFCRSTTDSLQCSVDFEEKCKKGDFRLDTQRKLVEYLKEVCSKSNPIYSVLVNNLKCVASVLDDNACYEDFPREEAFRNYSKALLDKGIDAFPGGEIDDIDCLMSVFGIACQAQKMEKCGKTAVDAFITIYQKVTSILLDVCGDKFSTYLPEIFSVMNGKET